ncbi:hypothetical protein H9X96_21910 [Pedobacter sp. N36a]|uniref:hypothetical protein n=1 Tax=Pedobacter sp. N36a TaxID=2767996 RepID=UPI0016570612|nr:hypothetical protein [Pedobacter sp. N36a]MBC8988415.1 hypothetical protein [Pedobacter sp. N36a]
MLKPEIGWSQQGISGTINISSPKELQENSQTPSITLRILSNKKELFSTKIMNSDTSIRYNFPVKTLIQLNLSGDLIKTRKLYLQTDTLVSGQSINIRMEKNIIELATVEIKQQQRFEERSDTLQIPVDSIKTRPHANSGELLNQIPGFNISSNGLVTAMGKKVNKVKVDGKELFGGNARATLDAIKSDMVQKVQLISSDNGSGQNDINLLLKQDRKNGKYGELSALAGTNSRHTLGIRVNSIRPGSFFNLFVNENNTNERAISDMDYLSMVSFSLENNNSGTQKIYYDHKLENPFENLERIMKKGDFNIGENHNLTAGANFNKSTDHFTWNNFILFERPNAEFVRAFSAKTLINPYTLDKRGLEHNHPLDRNVFGESTLKWKPNDNNTFSGKITANTRNTSEENTSESFNTIRNQANEVITEDQINFNRNYEKQGTFLHLKGVWEHRYEKPANKLTLIGGLVNNRYNMLNQYSNWSGDPFTTINNNKINQVFFETNYYSSISQSIVLLPKLLLDLNLTTVNGESHMNTNGFNLNQTTSQYNIEATALTAEQFRINKTTLTGQAFLYYKTGRVSAVASAGILKNNWEVEQEDLLLNKKTQYVFFPNFYANYSYNSGKNSISVTQTTVLVNPLMENLVPVYDSTYVQKVTLGNSGLIPYIQKNYMLNTSVFIKGIGSLNGQVSYGRNQIPVIDESIITAGFPVETYTQSGNGEQGNAILSLFRYSMESAVNTNFMLIYLWKKENQKFNEVLSALSLHTIIINGGLKWRIKPEHQLNVDLSMTFGKLKSSVYSSNNSNSRLFLTLNNDNKLPFNIYYQLNTKWLVLDDGTAFQFLRPVANISVSKYLGKHNSLRLNLGVANLLNVKTIKNIRSTIDQVSITEDRFLPRYPYLGLNFFPEIWKKK